VEDLQSVLRSFQLPFVGRKPELFQRVLSLINHLQYDIEFCLNAKRKIQQIYRQREDLDDEVMVPSLQRSQSKRKSTRYESDDSFEATSSSDGSDVESDESAFIVNTSDSDVESTRKKAPKKRIRNVGSKSSSSEDKSDSGDDHSSDEDSDVLDKYSSTRSQRQKENEMKKREKNEKLKKRMDDKKKRKRMEYNSPSDSSQDNDSGEEKRLNWRNWKSKSNPPKKRVRRIVSDDSDDNEVNGNRDLKSVDESHPEVTTTGAVHLVESDDDIEYLGSVPASQSTVVRDYYRQCIKYGIFMIHFPIILILISIAYSVLVTQPIVLTIIEGQFVNRNHRVFIAFKLIVY
jgi:hypothetical protein